ncbi:MAG: cytidine deaminase [Bacteroidales bacterium]|nr:cytidine deaminase [Bacteroidales bacterium]
MTNKEIKIAFKEYSSAEEMDAVDQELVAAAIEASKSSYAPYSHFNVGAAVRLEDGTIVKGSNQENAAYPSGICAERTAMFAAGAMYPDKAMVSLACVAGPDGTITDEPGTPCGACRQVMAQYQHKGGRDMSIILVGAKMIWKFDRVDDILPFIFNSLD